jgi:hypothetical protein
VFFYLYICYMNNELVEVEVNIELIKDLIVKCKLDISELKLDIVEFEKLDILIRELSVLYHRLHDFYNEREYYIKHG